MGKMPGPSRAKMYFIPTDGGELIDASSHLSTNDFTFNFSKEEKEGDMGSNGGFVSGGYFGKPHVTVCVDDLLTVFPSLRRPGETDAEFAAKVAEAAKWNRGADADSDLISRLYPDTFDEAAEKRNEKEGA